MALSPNEDSLKQFFQVQKGLSTISLAGEPFDAGQRMSKIVSSENGSSGPVKQVVEELPVLLPLKSSTSFFWKIVASKSSSDLFEFSFIEQFKEV